VKKVARMVFWSCQSAGMAIPTELKGTETSDEAVFEIDHGLTVYGTPH
jgi:hypothetical protein